MFNISRDANEKLQINNGVGILTAAGPMESGGVSDEVDDGVDDCDSSMDNMTGSRQQDFPETSQTPPTTRKMDPK